jgi:hypothetical protein
MYHVEAKLRANWPVSPDKMYEDWVSWKDLLLPKFLTYPEASKAAREEGFTTQQQYKSNVKPIKGLPHNPEDLYSEEWISWKEYLGSRYLTLSALRKAVKKEKVSREHSYRKIHYKLHKDWPSNPMTFYEGWVSWPHLFGRKARKQGRPRNDGKGNLPKEEA